MCDCLRKVLCQIFNQWKYFVERDVVLEQLPLRQFVSAIKEKNCNKQCTLVLTNSAEYGVVAQSDFFDRKIAQDRNIDKYTVVKKGDFIYNPRISKTAPAGPIKRSKIDEGVVSPLYTVFRINNGQISGEYLRWYFESGEWIPYAKSVANYGARFDRMNISNQDFFDMPIPIPEKETQDRICNFLNVLQKKVTLQEEKVITLQKVKQAFMQQMFV